MAYKKLFGISQRRAFRRLVSNNRGRLYRMAYAWTSDPHLADDLVQQTLLKALSNQKQLRDFAAAEGWMFRILANCLTDSREPSGSLICVMTNTTVWMVTVFRLILIAPPLV